MDLGNGARVFLATAPGAPQHTYVKGDTIGEFKLLEISRTGLIFGWEDKRVAARFDELKDASARAKAETAASASASARQAAQPATSIQAQAPPNRPPEPQRIGSDEGAQGVPAGIRAPPRGPVSPATIRRRDGQRRLPQSRRQDAHGQQLQLGKGTVMRFSNIENFVSRQRTLPALLGVVLWMAVAGPAACAQALPAPPRPQQSGRRQARRRCRVRPRPPTGAASARRCCSSARSVLSAERRPGQRDRAARALAKITTSWTPA